MRYRYILDKENLVYKQEKVSLVSLIKSHRVKLIIGFGIGLFVFTLFYFNKLQTPSLYILNKKESKLISKINKINDKYDSVLSYLEEVKNKDESFYRVVSKLEPVSDYIRYQGFGGTNTYANLTDFKSADLLINTNKRSDILIKQLQFQKKSLNTLLVSLLKINDSLLSIPAILPVSPFTYHRVTSPFGVRKDPMSGKLKKHMGIDFAGKIGKPVYATGNGVVSIANKSNSGYGNRVTINHGFGYKTVYAHLHNIYVKVGDTISRGQQIGTVGNTGKSTGPHLHYEVVLNNNKKDPKYFYTNDLSADEFSSILKSNSN